MIEEPLILVVIGVMLGLLQAYIEIDTYMDDKYISKKSTDVIINELIEKKKMNGKLKWWDSMNLSTRVFVKKRFILKFAFVLIIIGIILKSI